MKRIELKSESLMHVMYGLLLPAVGGTVFWWLIQHVQGGRAIEIVTSSVIVYYLCLHFVAGQQIDSTHYGKVGFLLDLVVIVAIEGLFFSVDAAHKHLEMGMVALLAILVVLFLWNIKTSKSSGLSDSFNNSPFWPSARLGRRGHLIGERETGLAVTVRSG